MNELPEVALALLQQGRESLCEQERQQQEANRLTSQERQQRALCHWQALLDAVRPLFPEPLWPWTNLTDAPPEDWDGGTEHMTGTSKFTARLELPGLAPVLAYFEYGFWAGAKMGVRSWQSIHMSTFIFVVHEINRGDNSDHSRIGADTLPLALALAERQAQKRNLARQSREAAREVTPQQCPRTAESRLIEALHEMIGGGVRPGEEGGE